MATFYQAADEQEAKQGLYQSYSGGVLRKKGTYTEMNKYEVTQIVSLLEKR